MAEPRLVVTAQRSRSSVRGALDQSGLGAAPVVDEAGRFEGIVALSDLQASGEGEQAVAELVDAGAPTVSATSRLDVALESLTTAPQSWLVLDDERRVVGTLSISDVVRADRHELVSSVERMSDLGVTAGATQVTMTPDSAVVGKTLRHADFPPGLLVTSISRGDKVLYPDGETVLEVGDQLTVIGSRPDVSRIGELAASDAVPAAEFSR